MSKNIISRLFVRVNANIGTADALISSSQRPGRDLLTKLEQAHQVQASLYSLIDSDLLHTDDVMWEHEGGDPLLSTKLLPSAERTTYLSAYHSWCREQGLYTDLHETPAEYQRQVDIEQASGLHRDEWEHVPYDVCLDAAMAVYARLHHLGNYQEFKWIHSMDIERDGEKQTIRTCVPISEWAIMQAEESTSPKRAEFLRLFSEAVKDDWKHLSLDDSEAIIKPWLDELVEDRDGNSSRRQRIVGRCADRMFDEVQLGIMSNDHKRTIKAFKYWELLLASPKLARIMSEYKASREYKLDHLTKMTEQLEAKLKEKEETERLDQLQAQLEGKLKALMGEPNKAESESEETPEPEVKVTELPYIAPGANPAWRDRLDEIKRRNGRVH